LIRLDTHSLCVAAENSRADGVMTLHIPHAAETKTPPHMPCEHGAGDNKFRDYSVYGLVQVRIITDVAAQ